MKWDGKVRRNLHEALVSAHGRFVVSFKYNTRSFEQRVQLTDNHSPDADAEPLPNGFRVKRYLCLDQESAKTLAEDVANGKGVLAEHGR